MLRKTFSQSDFEPADLANLLDLSEFLFAPAQRTLGRIALALGVDEFGRLDDDGEDTQRAAGIVEDRTVIDVKPDLLSSPLRWSINGRSRKDRGRPFAKTVSITSSCSSA